MAIDRKKMLISYNPAAKVTPPNVKKKPHNQDFPEYDYPSWRMQACLNWFKIMMSGSWADSNYVFTQENGEWMTPDRITAWSKFNELSHIRPHMFRYTAASTWLQITWTWPKERIVRHIIEIQSGNIKHLCYTFLHDSKRKNRCIAVNSSYTEFPHGRLWNIEPPIF